MARSISAALLVLVALVLAAPQAAAQPATKTPVVLFICPHGAAKSVMASAYVQKLAKERGLNVRVDAAGTDPEPTSAPTSMPPRTGDSHRVTAGRVEPRGA